MILSSLSLQRIDLSPMGREEIGELLLNRGFYKKESKDADVPEEFKEGPYIPKTVPETTPDEKIEL